LEDPPVVHPQDGDAHAGRADTPAAPGQVEIFTVPEPPRTRRWHDAAHRKRALLMVGLVVAAALLGWIVARTVSPVGTATPTPAADVTPNLNATPASGPPATVPTAQPSEPTASDPSDTNPPSAQPSPPRKPGHIGEIRGARYFSEQVLSTRTVGSTYKVRAEVCLRELPPADPVTAAVSIRAWSVLAGGERIFASSKLSSYPKTYLVPGSCQQGEIGFATQGQPVTKIIYQNSVPEKVVVW
jgi:hypothetical protein